MAESDNRWLCSHRFLANVSVSDFMAQVPAQFERSGEAMFSVDWWRRLTPEGSGSDAMPIYTIQWHPLQGGHYRSASMDASTGWWTQFSYLPGERLDP